MAQPTTPSTTSVPNLVNRPSLVEYGNYRFLIHDAPTDNNLSAYIAIYQKRHVTCIVRACEATYSIEPLIVNSIKIYEMPYSDGEAPPEEMLTNWLNLCKQEFGELKTPSNKEGSSSSSTTVINAHENKETKLDSNGSMISKESKRTIAVHCVAGLGRAPVLVCVALIEYCNFSPLDAVDYVRKRRRGAINARQLKFIESYKPRMKNNKDKCIIC